MRWKDSTLGKLAKNDGGLIQAGPFGAQLHQSNYQSEGIPVIMPKDIADGRVSVESIALFSENMANRLFGGYVSCYDFKRSEEDGATVKLVYESRGEKLVNRGRIRPVQPAAEKRPQ